MNKGETFSAQLRAIPPGESRTWELDPMQMMSKRQLVTRLNQLGAQLSTSYTGGRFTVTNNAKGE